jgi:hypothetical protein
MAQAKARHPDLTDRFFNVGFIVDPQGESILQHYNGQTECSTGKWGRDIGAKVRLGCIWNTAGEVRVSVALVEDDAALPGDHDVGAWRMKARQVFRHELVDKAG